MSFTAHFKYHSSLHSSKDMVKMRNIERRKVNDVSPDAPVSSRDAVVSKAIFESRF